MLRSVLTAALLAALAHGAIARDRDAPPRLRELVTVTGDVVRIGDLIDNAGEAAGIAVFRSPDLGHTGTVPSDQILSALRAHDFDRVETGDLTEVVVTRLSRAMGSKDIEERIVRALSGHRGLGAPENLKVVLDRDLRPLHFESHATGELAVGRLHVEPRSGRFDVTFDLPESTVARRMRLRFTGTVTETLETATLLRPLARGEIVRNADVALERRPKSEIAGDPLSLEQVIGMSVKRAMRPGQPLRAADLARPEVVQRNQTVTIVFEAPGMLLTVRGKALEGGGTGDHIAVLNIQSNRTVQGEVTGPGKVVVNAAMPRAVTAAVSSNSVHQ
jgi:flagellar basal body P-ring formation protein FlgA